MKRGKKGKSQIRTNNFAEVAVLLELEADGYEVIKKGWPDFIAVKGNEVRFIEVKPLETCNLKKQQKRVADIFATLGLKVELKVPSKSARENAAIYAGYIAAKPGL